MYHLEKKFNLGLNLDADISELDKFFSQNRDLISSVYFSLPLGAAYYSRTKLREEYAENQDQLLNALDIIRANGIKLEVTFNTELILLLEKPFLILGQMNSYILFLQDQCYFLKYIQFPALIPLHLILY